MTFDFFNASNLAFGAKLTGAFIQLHQLAEAGEKNLERVKDNVKLLERYTGRNYLVARPTSGDRPCRTNEIFNLIDDIKYRLDVLEYTNNQLHIKAHIFNERNSRITVAEGSTSLKEGYVFYIQAKNNAYKEEPMEIVFADDIKKGKGELLFQYRIDDSGAININGLDAGVLGLIPFDSSQYASLTKGEDLQAPDSYTAQDYECLCIVGRVDNISVKLNGDEILRGYGHDCLRHCIIYVKPDDVITGTYSKIFKINYNRR